MIVPSVRYCDVYPPEAAIRTSLCVCSEQTHPKVISKYP